MGTLEATARVYAAAVAGPVHGIASSMLGEFERELATTRTFLSRVPEGKLEWRPHPKSMTAGQLALHIAEVPLGVLSMAMLDEAEVPDMSRPRLQAGSVKDVLDALEKGAAFVRATLPTIDDVRMMEEFKVMRGGKVAMAVPRVGFLRMIMLNHWYHHRGQLGVYLRLLGVSVPVSYGPSGDEAPF